MAAELTAAERPASGGTTCRLFGNQWGPAAAVASGAKGLVTSLVFEMKTGGGWREGYWLWVCGSGQSTAPQTFTRDLPRSRKSAWRESNRHGQHGNGCWNASDQTHTRRCAGATNRMRLLPGSR